MSLTTWKLPDGIGGSEAEGRLTTFAGKRWWYFEVDGTQLYVRESDLVEVKPPEPAEMGWYLATIGESTQIVRKVEADGWSVGSNGGFLSTWKTLNEDFPGITMVRLIPEPEPVALPWGAYCATASGDRLVVREPDDDRQIPVVIPGYGSVYLTVADARFGARALWTAADQAEASDATAV